MSLDNSKYPESPRRLTYLRELLALVAVVLTVINVFATTTSGPRVRIRTYIQSPTSHDADATNIWTGAGSLRLQLRRAAMTPEESVHYKLETDAGGVEWASVLPHGRGVVFLNSTTSSSDPSSTTSSTSGKTPYRIAMFHQLDCLNVLREEMVLLRHTHTSTHTSPNPPTTSSSSTLSSSTPNRAERAEFCLNYLRESILCHADSHLERVRSEFGLESGERGRAVVLGTERTDCVDWEGVWRAVEANWGEVMG